MFDNTNQRLKSPVFPLGLDGDDVLFHVHNTSETRLRVAMDPDSSSVLVDPRDWGEAERWSRSGGILNIEGELIYYGDVIVEERGDGSGSERIVGFTNLIRGYDGTGAAHHHEGDWVRGFVMAEHHNALARAVEGIETLMGVDGSADHESIDYRLRDLQELQVEPDDYDCPYGVYWYETVEDGGGEVRVRFHISIIGEYTRFEFYPRAGADPITDTLEPEIVYRRDEEIAASVIVYSDRCCACNSADNSRCEPCQFEPLFDDIPVLDLPQIDPWTLPVIPCQPCPPPSCTPCTPCITTTCPTVTGWPSIIRIDGFQSMITVDMLTNIHLQSQSVDVNVNVNVDWLNQQGQSGDGACFMLVPCGGTPS